MVVISCKRGDRDTRLSSGDHAPVLEDQYERPSCQCGLAKVRLLFLTPGFQIRIRFFLIRIQHFIMNRDLDFLPASKNYF